MSQNDNPATETAVIEKEGVLKRKAKEVAFLATVTGASLFGGFSYALSLAKKKDPSMFTKGLVGTAGVPESGGALAMRALGWGTLYAFTGVSLISYGFWKLSGAKNMEEFRAKMQSGLPKMPKSENPGKSDFKTVRELVNYVIEEDAKSKERKKGS